MVELRSPVDVKGALGADNPMMGILGATLGESKADAEARIQEAKKTATDLSSLVRKKEKKTAEEPANETGAKRKADGPADGAEEAKKAKPDEAEAMGAEP